MKVLLFAFIVLLASCGTTHKIITSSKKTVDSAATVTKDTSHVSHETTASDNLEIKDVHIRVEYGNRDTVAWEPYYYKRDSVKASDYYPAKKKVDKYADLIREAIASSGQAGRISSVTIDIGSLSDSSYKTEKKDSGSGKTVSTVDLKKTDSEKSKDVTRTGMSLGFKIGIGLFILIALIIWLIMLARKFSWFKIF